MKTLALNKKGLFDYEILENYEAGIVLTGQEVKSTKLGRINLKGAFVSIKKDQAYLKNCHISAYELAGPLPHYDPTHPRKLLLRKKELNSLIGKTHEKGLTLIPVKVYTKKGLIKLEIALAKGKKKADKRESIKKREVQRELQRRLKNNG